MVLRLAALRLGGRLFGGVVAPVASVSEKSVVIPTGIDAIKKFERKLKVRKAGPTK